MSAHDGTIGRRITGPAADTGAVDLAIGMSQWIGKRISSHYRLFGDKLAEISNTLLAETLQIVAGQV